MKVITMRRRNKQHRIDPIRSIEKPEEGLTKGIPINKYNTFAESNVQSEIYHRLRNDDIEVYTEYKIGRLRCDLVVVKDGYVKGAIEVKKKKRKTLNHDTRQYTKYMNLNLPIIYCLGSDNINNTINEVKNSLLQDEVKVSITVLN